MSNNLKAFFNVSIGFLPLIFLWSISNEMGIILGLVSTVGLIIKEVITKNKGIISRVLLVYFVIISIVYFYLKIDSVIQYETLVSYIVLALTGFISVILGKPYTMYEARSGYNADFGDSPLFIEVNILITKIWAVIYSINAIIEIAGHNVMSVIFMNVMVIIGIILSITIPGALPEA